MPDAADAPTPVPRLAEGGRTRLLIGDAWVEAASGQTFETVTPSTGRPLAHVAAGDRVDVDAAVGAARRAFEGPWARAKPAERQAILLDVASAVEREFDELARLDTLDMGMPITKARSNLRIAVGQLRYNAGLATAICGDTIQNSVPGDIVSYTLKEPVGVVGAIMAWNGPVGSFIRKTAPALAAGCTIVVKPAEEASLTAVRLAEIFLEAGVPPGVLNLVTGGPEAGRALAEHGDVDLVTFTGSHRVGQEVVRAAAGNVKRTLVELGGKSPNIVFADAELDGAVAGAAMAAFGNSGQVCSAGTRLLVERPIYEQFTEQVAAYARQLRIGDGMDPEVVLGPVASREQLDRINRYIALGQAEGARLLDRAGTPSDAPYANGFFVSPAVFRDVDNDMTIARDEIFGPVLGAMPFDSADEAIAVANATPFGLGAGVWTTDLRTAVDVSRRIRTGTVWVNCYNVLDAAVPFGGYKASGHGRERGREHLDEHLQTKAVWIRTA